MARMMDMALFYRFPNRKNVLRHGKAGIAACAVKYRMNFLTLDQTNSATVAQWLEDGRWVTACLCAAWCDTCNSYRSKFAELASVHPEHRFVWIDIEDQADLVGDFDIENFPTLLIQRKGVVSFFGTTLPEIKLADRLLRAQIDKDDAELRREAASSEERREWQSERNLAGRLSQP